MMTEEEVRAAVLAALLDYETLKKTRRLKSVKKAVRGTVMATMIGSTGIMAANTGRQATASAPVTLASQAKSSQQQAIAGVVHFGMAQDVLMSGHIERLMSLTGQLPKGTVLTVIGRADLVGGYAYNKKLAERRALGVANFLARQGFKIKQVGGKVDNDKVNGWLSRRVDIVINHPGSEPLAINLPPILDQYGVAKNDAPRADLIQRQDKTVAVQPRDSADKNQPLLPSGQNFKKEDAVPKASEVKSETGTDSKTSPQLAMSQQKVRAVAVFAYKHHALTVAHKERLFNLIKQLPRNAELIIVGRTDPHEETGLTKKLGKERARAVANYLANHGVKVIGIATKAARFSAHGCMARRVDVIVRHHSPNKVAIHLPVTTHQHDEIKQKVAFSHKKKIASKDHKKITQISEKIAQTLDNPYLNQ